MRVQVVVNLNRSSHPQAMAMVAHYLSKLTDNHFFNKIHIIRQMGIVSAAVVALRSAIASSNSATRAEQIKLSRKMLDQQVNKLVIQIERMANHPNLTDDQRIAMVHSAGMNVRVVEPTTHSFTALKGNRSGSVHLIAAQRASAHEWQFATDLQAFSDRRNAPPTERGVTDIVGLRRDTTYAFFHKPVILGERTDWEGPVFLTVE